MIPRTLEPIPNDPHFDAEAYMAMDHREVNGRFVEDLLAGGPIGSRIIDMGCGPALIPILLCEKLEGLSVDSRPGGDSPIQVMAIDHEVEMLELARFEIELASLVDQIHLQQIDLTDPDGLHSEIADCVISNTVMHHLPKPQTAIELALRALKPNGRLFIRDLARPETADHIEELVREHGQPDDVESEAPTPEMQVYQTQLFRQSLHAALTIQEAQAMVESCGLPTSSVSMTSDRHWTLDTLKPSFDTA